MRALLILILLAGRALGATWYLDINATGTRSGTSWANAWTNFGGIVWGASGVKAGDTLAITNGPYPGKLTIGASGTAANPITIQAHGVVVFDRAGVNDDIISANSIGFIRLDGGATTNLVLMNAYANSDGPGPWAISATGAGGWNISGVLVSNVNDGFLFSSASFTNVIAWNRFTYVRANCAIRALNGPTNVWDALVVSNNTFELNSDLNGTALGPEAVQANDSSTAADNVVMYQTGTHRSFEHQDAFQLIGTHLRLNRNRVVNCPGAGLESGTTADGLPYTDVEVIGNLFYITNSAMQGLSRGIEMLPRGNVVSNITILNNGFADLDGWYGISIRWVNGPAGLNPSVRALTIENNWFINSGDGSHQAIFVEGSTNYTTADLTCDYNLLNAASSGSTAINIDGASFTQAHGQTGLPVFVSYSDRSPANDFNLTSSDTAARGQGTNNPAALIDIQGLERTDPYDIGPYKYVSAGGGAPIGSVTEAERGAGVSGRPR